MKKIGPDGNMVYDRVVTRSRNLEMFLRYCPEPEWPWLDVGAGESWLRDQLDEICMQRFGKRVITSEIDLDVEPYPFPDDHFSTITSFELLEHLYNPLFHLQQLHRIIAGGGCI
jgi:SAM-dependent methyltransferase